MRIRLQIFSAIFAASLMGCSSDRISAPPPPPPPTGTLLKDVVYTRLPSPYYHFEYDELGKITTASFASGLATYSLHYYLTDRIHDIDVSAGTIHNLIYTYDDAGRVAAIRDRDETGGNAQLWFFTYNGQQLTSIERDRAVTGGFIVDLTMSFLYDADGNLLELGQHYPPIDGVQPEQTLIDLFENYDQKVNVDDFDLLHPGFFDKLILLPGVKLQKGNPARLVHLGDGDHYTVDFTYTYNNQNRPLTRAGTLNFQTGPNAGQSFAVDAAYSYY